MSIKQLEQKYNCIIDKDIGIDSGTKYYMVFDLSMQPLFSAYTIREVEQKFKDR